MIDPTTHGAVRTGVWTFRFDIPLPPLEFGPPVAGIATRFEWTSIVGSPAGMTIGGGVRPLADPGTVTLQTAVTAMGRPRGTVYASQHGCTPHWQQGGPDELTVTGSVGLAGCGFVCRFNVLPPHEGLEQFVAIDETSAEAQTLRVRLPVDVAGTITEPVRLIVNTSRGIRLIDLGTPQSGDAAEISYIDDCLYADTYLTELWAYDEWHAMWGHLPEFWHLIGPPPAYPERPNPLDDPDPAFDQAGIYVKLIEIEDWEPGELIQVRAGDCTIDVTADLQGRAVIPVIVAGDDRAQPISLKRVNRRDVTTARARTAVFHRQAALPGGDLGNALTVDTSGNALLRRDFEDGSDLIALARSSGAREVASRSPSSEAAAGAQALATSESDLDLPGLAEVVQVPGFADAPVRIAVMDDGTRLVINLSADGSARVAGVYDGPLPRLDETGDWALAAARGRVTVYWRGARG